MMAEFVWGVFVGACVVGSVWCVWAIAEAARKARGYEQDYQS